MDLIERGLSRLEYMAVQTQSRSPQILGKKSRTSPCEEASKGRMYLMVSLKLVLTAGAKTNIVKRD